MKSTINIRTAFIAIALSGIAVAGCKKSFLDETPVSTLTTDVYYKTEAGFEDLVRSCYPLLRNIHQTRQLVLNGTDLYTPGGFNDPKFATNPANAGSIVQYDAGFNPTLGDLNVLWTLLYTEIGRANTAVSRAEGITTMADALKGARVSEAKFLRSLAYFYLVQQWGDVPMPLTETQTASKEATRD